MRTWLTTREVQVTLGGLSQQRVSQLVRSGALVVERDPEGRLMYDRATVEHHARERSIRAAQNSQQADERKAIHREARDRLRREREERERAENEQRERDEQLKLRAVTALERIARQLGALVDERS